MLGFVAHSVLPSLERYQYYYKPGQSLGEGFLYQESAVGRLGQGQVRPLDAKIQTIAKFPIPTSRKALARFLGMAGYYRNFCLNFFRNFCTANKFVKQKGKVRLDR